MHNLMGDVIKGMPLILEPQYADWIFQNFCFLYRSYIMLRTLHWPTTLVIISMCTLFPCSTLTLVLSCWFCPGKYWQKLNNDRTKNPRRITFADKNAPNKEVWQTVSNLVHRSADISFIADEYLECGIYAPLCLHN